MRRLVLALLVAIPLSAAAQEAAPGIATATYVSTSTDPGAAPLPGTC
jgi:hypothetical protein